MKFNIGDHVVVRKSNIEDDGFIFKGKTGKIIDIWDTGDDFPYLIRMDDASDEIYCSVDRLVNEDKIVITHDGKTTYATLFDGNKTVTTTARCAPEDTFDFMTGAKLALERLEEKVKSKYNFKSGDFAKIVGNCCFHGFEIGTVVTLKRTNAAHMYDATANGRYYLVMDKDLEAYTPPKYYNGKVVCVESPYCWFTVGKVYEVVNGRITADDGSFYPKRDLEGYCDAADVKHAGCGGGADFRHNPKNTFVPLVED